MCCGFEQRRVWRGAEGSAKGVSKVRLRSIRGYQHDLLRYCDEKENKWCGRIEFAVAVM